MEDSPWCVDVIASQDFEISVEFGKMLDILDVVLVSLDVETNIFANQLLHLLEVHVVSQVVASESLVAVHSLLQLLELLDSTEDISIIRLDIVSLDQLHFHRLRCILAMTKFSECLSLNESSSFH